MADIDFIELPNPISGSLSEDETKSWAEDRGEVGSPRRRNRFTRALESFSFSLRLTNAQKEALKAFYDVTLVRGVEAFNWTHPTSAEVYEVQFAQKPKPTHVGGSVDLWDVQVNLVEI